MCMKNVNITAIPCNAVIDNSNSLIGVFDTVVAEKHLDNGELFLPHFNLFLDISIILPEGQESENEIAVGNKFDILVRFTHIASQLGTTLAEFSLELEEKDVCHACRDYWEFHRIIYADNLVLHKAGKHAVKILIKRSDETVWNVQSLHSIDVIT